MIESETFTTVAGYKKALANLIIKLSAEKKKVNLLNIFLCFADTSAFCFNEVQGFEDKVKIGKHEGIKWVLRYSDTI